jgi:hypothetical protein
MPTHLVSKTLDPRKDRRLLNYYFNVYDWRYSSLVGRFSREDGLQEFPRPEDLPHKGPVLILISGTGQTGRSSLVNLVLYKIETLWESMPIIVETSLDGFDKAQNMKNMARLFIQTYALEEAAPTEEQLWKIYERETKEPSTGIDAHYTALFSSLRLVIKKFCNRPIVFLIMGADDYDLWACIYNSSIALAEYLIVETSKTADALTCHTLMTNKGKNVAHINALMLDSEAARQYLVDRLSSERPADLPADDKDDLMPFTEEALEILYKPGTSIDPEKAAPVRHPIGWLRETFRRVLKEHLDELSKIVEANPQELENPGRLIVNGKKMWNVRQAINQGR